jgi:hypothetical protein
MRLTPAIPIVLAVVLYLASPALASNVGFAYRLNIPAGSGGTLTWLALPWFYSPTTSVNAEALCQDLQNGTASVTAVLAWDEASAQMVSYTCGSGTGFVVQEGIAYGVLQAPGQAISTTIVGSHDDAYAYSIPPTTGANLTFVSIPYHHHILDVAGAPGVVDAEDLCQSVGASLAAVVRYDGTAGAYTAHACGSTLDEPFALALGTGYGLVNAEGQTITWQPPHF